MAVIEKIPSMQFGKDFLFYCVRLSVSAEAVRGVSALLTEHLS